MESAHCQVHSTAMPYISCDIRLNKPPSGSWRRRARRSYIRLAVSGIAPAVYFISSSFQ